MSWIISCRRLNCPKGHEIESQLGSKVLSHPNTNDPSWIKKLNNCIPLEKKNSCLQKSVILVSQ